MCITQEMQNKVKVVSKYLCILRRENKRHFLDSLGQFFLEEVLVIGQRPLMMGGFLMGGGGGQAEPQAPVP